jgi:hypothetical protein
VVLVTTVDSSGEQLGSRDATTPTPRVATAPAAVLRPTMPGLGCLQKIGLSARRGMFHGRVLSVMDGMGHFEISGDWHFCARCWTSAQKSCRADVHNVLIKQAVTCVVV